MQIHAVVLFDWNRRLSRKRHEIDQWLIDRCLGSDDIWVTVKLRRDARGQVFQRDLFYYARTVWHRTTKFVRTTRVGRGSHSFELQGRARGRAQRSPILGVPFIYANTLAHFAMHHLISGVNFLSHSVSLALYTLLMMSHSLIHLPPAHHSHPPSHIDCFLPGSKLDYSTNLFHHSLLAPTWTAFSDYWTGLLCSTFFSFLVIFLFFFILGRAVE